MQPGQNRHRRIKKGRRGIKVKIEKVYVQGSGSQQRQRRLNNRNPPGQPAHSLPVERLAKSEEIITLGPPGLAGFPLLFSKKRCSGQGSGSHLPDTVLWTIALCRALCHHAFPSSFLLLPNPLVIIFSISAYYPNIASPGRNKPKGEGQQCPERNTS